jgi:hypothetical protein
MDAGGFNWTLSFALNHLEATVLMSCGIAHIRLNGTLRIRSSGR